jgi:hypothetical protein
MLIRHEFRIVLTAMTAVAHAFAAEYALIVPFRRCEVVPGPIFNLLQPLHTNHDNTDEFIGSSMIRAIAAVAEGRHRRESASFGRRSCKDGQMRGGGEHAIVILPLAVYSASRCDEAAHAMPIRRFTDSLGHGYASCRAIRRPCAVLTLSAESLRHGFGATLRPAIQHRAVVQRRRLYTWASTRFIVSRAALAKPPSRR